MRAATRPPRFTGNIRPCERRLPALVREAQRRSSSDLDRSRASTLESIAARPARPRRLAWSRTHAFHACNTGSNPVGVIRRERAGAAAPARFFVHAVTTTLPASSDLFAQPGISAAELLSRVCLPAHNRRPAGRDRVNWRKERDLPSPALLPFRTGEAPWASVAASPDRAS